MQNTQSTASTIAHALLGKTHAWQLFVPLALDVGPEQAKALVMLEITAISPATNSRKAAGKTTSNMASLVSWALANNVALQSDKGIVSISSLNKVRAEANASAEEVASSEANASAEEVATSEDTANRLALAQDENMQLRALLDQVKQATSLKQVRAILKDYGPKVA